jgi:hypothetical protein
VQDFSKPGTSEDQQTQCGGGMRTNDGPPVGSWARA